jgi:D-alanine-D-alanine ligase
MKIRVAVIFGGESCEHEISCISANQALHALNNDKYEVIPVYVSKEREFYTGNDLFDLSNYRDLNILKNKLKKVYFIKVDNKAYLRLHKKNLFSKDIELDVAMPIMHGTNGEDGTIQGVLEMLKLPYTTSNVASSSVGQDKIMMKQILDAEKIKICSWFWLYGFEFNDNKDSYTTKANKLGYPVIIKPANLGSSIGIEIAHNDQEFGLAINQCMKYDDKIVVEKVVEDLLEINCSVLGNRFNCKASVLEEVFKNDEILSFDDKYQPKGAKSKLGGSKKLGTKVPSGSKGMASTSRCVPARINDILTNDIKKIAVNTFKVLGSSGVVRIDFLINKSTNEIYVNEINSIPGSLANYLWSPLGYSFSDLLEELIKIAIDNKRHSEKMIYSFDTNILQNF